MNLCKREIQEILKNNLQRVNQGGKYDILNNYIY